MTKGATGGPVAARSVAATNSKKPAAPAATAAAADPAAGQKARVVSNSSSSGGSRPCLVPQLPLQAEDDLLKGCGFQAIWSENFEVSGLMNAAVKICRY